MIPHHRFEDYAQRSAQSSTGELEELHREHEMQTTTEISAHSWLNKGHPLGRNESINWKLGALLLGDGHIGGTPNEGLTQSEGLKFFHQFTNLLTQKAEAGDDSLDFLQDYISKIKEFSKQISEAETYSDLIEEIADLGKDSSEADRSLLLDRYADKLLNIFKRKGGGWLPIGWTTWNGESHAMLAHIDMKGKMTIVNTGGGTDNHPSISVSSQDPLTGELKEELKVQEFITYEGIDTSKLERRELFRFFLELKIRAYWDGLIDFSAENIYGPLKNYLSVGEKKALSPFTHPKAYKKPQKSGTCAIKSISTALYYMLTDSFNHGGNREEKAVECYKKMKYLWQTQALVELGLQIGPSSNATQKHFLEDFVENICRSAEKLHKKGLLEENDLIELNCTVEDIRRRLDSSETIQEEQPTLAAIEPGLLATAEGDSLYPEEDIFIKEDYSELLQGTLLGTRSQSLSHREDEDENTLKAIYEGLPRIHAITSPSEKIKEFLLLLKTITPGILGNQLTFSFQNYETLAPALLDVQASFISTLPIPVKGEPSVWSQMSPAETVETMESVYQLMNFLNQLRFFYPYRTVVVEPVGVKSNTANIHFKNSEFNDLYEEDTEDLSARLTIYRANQAKKSHPADFIVISYALLAINDQLARTLPETKLEGFEINYHDLFFEMRSPHFILKTPQLQSTLDKVAKYFNPYFSLEALVLREEKEVIKVKCNSLFAYKDMSGERFTPGMLVLDSKKIRLYTTTRYYLQFLQEIKNDPAKLNQFYALTAQSKHPATPTSTELEHLVCLIESTTEEKSLIPKSVRLLQQSALYCLKAHFFTRGSSPEDSKIYQSHSSFKPGKVTVNIQGFVNRGTGSYADIQDENLERAFYSDLETYNAVDWQRELSRENEIILGQKTLYEQTLDLSREIEMVAVDPYDEVARALSFLKNHLHLLKKREIQNLIEAAFFKFGRLDSQLCDEPKIANEILTVIQDALNHYKSVEELETCLYLAKLGQEFFSYVKGAGVDVHDRNYRSVIYNEILPLFKENPSAKMRCHETLINFYRKATPEEFNTLQSREELLYDLASFWTLKAINQDTRECSNLGIIESKLLPLIKEALLESDFRNRSLNGLVRQFYPNAVDLPWEGKFPFFENERYSYNLFEGILFDKQQGQYAYLPKEIYLDEKFKKIFLGKIETCEKIERGRVTIYRINTALEDNLVITKERGELKFQRIIEGRKYTLVETPETLTTELPRLVDETSHCWVHGGSNPHMTLFRKSGKPLLHVELEQKQSHRHAISNVYRYHDEGVVDQSLTWTPFKNTAPSMLFLNNLEPDHRYIECWSDHSTNSESPAIQKLELPRLNLSFQLKSYEGRQVLFCQEHPGYYLVENPKVLPLPKMERFITLQNRAGERKVLLPRVQLEASFNDSPFDREVVQEAHPPYTLLEYTLGETEVKSNKMEGKLYTLYHTLAVGDFNKAIRELQALNPLNRFTDDTEGDVKERTVLEWIFELLAQDKHPAAKAIYLKLAVKAIQNELKYPRAINSAPDLEIFKAAELLEELRSYTDNSSNVTTAKVSENEEKVLINFIQKCGDVKITSDLEKLYTSLRSEYRKYLETGSATLGTRTISLMPPLIHFETHKEQLIKAFFYEFYSKTSPPKLHHLIHKEEFYENHFFHLYQIAQEGSENDRKRLRDILLFNNPFRKYYLMILQNVLNNPLSYPTIEELAEAERKDDDDRNRHRGSKVQGHLNSLISKIVPNPLSIFWENIKKTSQFILDYFFGKFSILTKLHEKISTVFRPTYRKDKPKESGLKRARVEYDSTTLQQADKAFDHYLQTLLTKYFAVEETTIQMESTQLPEEHSNIHVARKLKAENEDLAYHRTKIGTTKKVYSQKVGIELKGLVEELHETATNLEVRLKTQKSALLWILNSIPEQTEHRSLKKLHKTGFHHEIQWEDLQKITLKGNLETFIERTHLTEEEAKKVMYGISDYLIKTSRLDQMKAVMAAAGNVKGIHGTENRKTYLQYIPKALELVRAYEPDSSNLEKQWFEAANHYLIRQEQLEKIREFIDPAYRHIQGEAPTGFGKTETVTPNLDFMRAAEGKLVFNTWPASLEVQNATNNKRQMDLSFGRKVDRFHFDRATELSTDSLKHTYEELLLDKSEGRPVNLRSESLRSLELHLLILLKEVSEVKGSTHELKGQVDYLLKILHLVRTEGWVTIDEEHVNLDPMDKLIYTVGDSIILPKKQIDVFETLFEFLTADELRQKLLEENQQYLLPDDAFENEIAPKLAEDFRSKLEVSEEQKESYDAFVLGTSGDIPDWLTTHPNKESIALVKGLLTQVLKSSLRGAVDEAFGLSKLHLKKKEFAIPYAFANTPKETKENPSQFKNPHETLTKTYLTYLYKGLGKDQLNKLVDFLQVQAKKELDDGFPLEETDAHAFFCKIAPNCHKSLLKLSDQEIEALYPELYKHRDVIFYYIRNIVVPELKIYLETLVSTVHDYRGQFASSLSLSATPQDKEAHGLDTHFVPMRGTSGQVTHLLLTKCKDPATLHPMKGFKPRELLAETFDIMEQNPRIHASIDIEANFKGLSNREVADEMRLRAKNRGDIQGILFFDESQGLFKMMDAATGNIHDAMDSHIEPEETQTYYDQSRCFGSDIKQAIDAVGLLMTGKNTSKAKAGQGAGRMRLWHNGQSVDVSYPEHQTNEIFKGEQPSIEKLIIHWLVNQVKSVESKNYQSQLGLMNTEIRRALLDRIEGVSISDKPESVSGGPNVEQALLCFNHWKSQFFKEESCDPWLMYASIPEEKESIEVLQDYQSECLKKAQAMPGLSKNEKAHITSRLNQYSKHWSEMILPEKVSTHPCDLGMECEVLEEVEVETQVEIEAQVSEDLQKRKPLTWPKRLNLFSDGWDKPKKINGMAKRITDAVKSVIATLAQIHKNIVGKLHRLSPRQAVAGICTPPVAYMIGRAVGVAPTVLTIVKVAVPILKVSAAALSLGYLIFKIAGRFSAFNEGVSLFKVNELINYRIPSFGKVALEIFTPNLLVSNNFYKEEPGDWVERAQTPMNIEQKPLVSLVVIMDEKPDGRKEVKAVIIDQNDSIYFRKKLQEDHLTTDESVAGNRKRQIGLYDISNESFTVQGKNQFDESDLKNPELTKLIAQAKFLNGEVKYSEEEMRYLAPCLDRAAKKVGYGPLQKMFERIVQYRPVNRKLLFKERNPLPIAKALGFIT